MAIDILVAGRLPPNVLPQLEDRFRLHTLPRDDDEADAMLQEVGGSIRGLLTNAAQGAPEALLAALPNLEIISSSGVGTDALNVEIAEGRGIRVETTPGVLTDDVADGAIALMLATTRRLMQAERNVRAGRWLKDLPLGNRMTGKRLGILGLGKIGQALARRAVAFDMPIAYHQRNRNPEVPYTYHDSVVSLAEASDFLVVIVPGGPATENMVDAQVLDALGPEGILINVGRGSTVDQCELIRALQQGRIRAAGLDVLADEPHVPEALLELDNVVLTPHYASGTIETRLAMGQRVADNLLEYFGAE
ncbi:2-hydroxyacid dehydrogenase [Marinobacter zhanjiangensis]|uniref:Dihydrofolate reductase n=1 Tax=Marinobacter zhanjiangensis TaxID=578215 RepID=A0ABQ3AXX5_9GAMM|nr:2-hydroxyacid dehydrogenase [Marinobacter zhanjiangensis]GGY67305.1 dihydrofolate reductase [Marinobacter zhanjiangensis]